MNVAPPGKAASNDHRALVAVDMGAESCRVSLLRRQNCHDNVQLVHRFPNRADERSGSLFWDLESIRKGIEHGLRQCASLAAEGIASIGVDGWAVDYVRLDSNGIPVADPYCYRDSRTTAAFSALHERISIERLYALTGIQPLTINTLYQLYADVRAGVTAGFFWMNLPEYILYWLGGKRVAEYTNATHTGMVDLSTRDWSPEIFAAAGIDIRCAPRIVAPGTIVGKLRGPLVDLPAFRDTNLIAPACHDTASAIAGIHATETEWAYISSGTWSLVGALLDKACNTEAAWRLGFTNLGATSNRICFHKNVNAMWILRQCIEHWAHSGTNWTVEQLVERAQQKPKPNALLDMDDPDLLPPGNMPARINAQRRHMGLPQIAEFAENAPEFANLIFHSLAQKYAQVLGNMKQITRKNPHCLYIVGGGSHNRYLNKLTEEATGLEVRCGEVESSTVGNFTIQQTALQ